MVRWYFAYDHLNYARYLSVYINGMLAILDQRPSAAEQLAAGNFFSSATKPILIQSDINGPDNWTDDELK